jgi:hypothetical protein
MEKFKDLKIGSYIYKVKIGQSMAEKDHNGELKPKIEKIKINYLSVTKDGYIIINKEYNDSRRCYYYLINEEGVNPEASFVFEKDYCYLVDSSKIKHLLKKYALKAIKEIEDEKIKSMIYHDTRIKQIRIKYYEFLNN